MAFKTIYIPLTEEFKNEAMNIISSTIENTSKRNKITLSNKEKNKIKNLSLDQINVNVTHKNKLKTMWIFDSELLYPVSIDFIDTKNINNCNYILKNNGEWEATKSTSDNLRYFNKKEFEQTALKNLLRDFETAAFYGTFSYGDITYG